MRKVNFDHLAQMNALSCPACNIGIVVLWNGAVYFPQICTKSHKMFWCKPLQGFVISRQLSLIHNVVNLT